MNNKTKIYRYIIGVLGVLLLGYFSYRFSYIIAWIIIAAVISTIGAPLVHIIEKIKIKRFHIPRSLSAAISLVTLYFIVFLFFRLFIPLIGTQTQEFQNIDVEQLSLSLEGPTNYINNFVDKNNLVTSNDFSIEDELIEQVKKIINVGDISNILSLITSGIGSLLMGLFSITFISFFFLKDQKLFNNLILSLVPTRSENQTHHALMSIQRLISRYFIGLILEIMCMATIICIGLLIVGLDFQLAVLIGLLAGCLNVIPYVGPWIGAAFGIVLAIASNLGLDFSADLLPVIIGIVVVFLIAQITDNVLFQPVIYSKSVKAHPLEIFIVIVIAGSLAGILGMMLAIPGYTVLRVVAKEFLGDFKIVRRLTDSIQTD